MALAAIAGVPEKAAVREALGRLCTRGVEPWWVQDHAEVLLNLACVAARAESSNGRIDRVGALTEILRELVERIRHQSYGKILWIVLGLDEESLGLSAGQRRERAGNEFRGGAKPVSAGTIRQHHEKRALDRLTVLLLEHERQHVARSRALADPGLADSSSLR